MKRDEQKEQMHEMVAEICPKAIEKMRDMLENPSTPVPSKVQLIGMVLERTLGRPETPVRVTTEVEGVAEAEEKLQAFVEEMSKGL